ncbi:MAG: hypothetical protein AAF458_09255 [Pseudomonadota bacterium]
MAATLEAARASLARLPSPQLRESLPVPRGYSLALSFNHVGMGRADPTQQVRGVEGALALQGPDGPLSIAALQEADHLDVFVWGADSEWIRPRLPALFGLLDRPFAFQPDAPSLRRLARRYAGLHLTRLPRLSTRLMQIVMLQLISWRDATRAWRRFISAHGVAAPGITVLRAPPRMSTVARLSPEAFVACGLTHAQGRAIINIAAHERLVERQSAQAPGAAVAALTGLHGIGPWSANYLLGTACGFADAQLLGDFGLPHSVAWTLTGAPRADDAQMLELLEPYRPHRFRIVRWIWASAIHAPRRGPRMAPNATGRPVV